MVTLGECSRSIFFLPQYWLFIFVVICPPVQGFVTDRECALGHCSGEEIGKGKETSVAFHLLLLA